MSRLLYRHGGGPANCPFLESLVQSGYHRLHAYSLRLGHVPRRRDVGLFPVESAICTQTPSARERLPACLGGQIQPGRYRPLQRSPA